MSKRMTGVIGASGRVGMECLRYLEAHCDTPLLAGGRKEPESATGLHGAGFMRLDLFDKRQLESFCRRCGLVINCAGPAALIGGRVAQAALRHGCHFVDAGGYTPLAASLDAGAVRGKSLRFLLTLGILPGLSEIFPPYVAAKEFDQVEMMRYAVIGRDSWTPVSAYDIAWGVGNIGKGEGACHYRNGKRIEGSVLGSAAKMTLPPPVGRHTLFRLMREDLQAFVEEKKIGTADAYSNNWGLWVSLATVAVRLFGLYRNDKLLRKAAGLIVAASRLDMRGKEPGFMLHLDMRGRKKGRALGLSRTLYFSDTYRATGVCAGIGARLILEKSIPPGIFCGASLPDPLLFMRHFLDQGYRLDGRDFPVAPGPAPDAPGERPAGEKEAGLS